MIHKFYVNCPFLSLTHINSLGYRRTYHAQHWVTRSCQSVTRAWSRSPNWPFTISRCPTALARKARERDRLGSSNVPTGLLTHGQWTVRYTSKTITIASTLLTHPPWTKWPPFLDDNFGCIFVSEKFVFILKFHRSLFLRVQLTVTQYWFR